MSQSAASEALLNLEQTYGVKLFDRASNRLSLNAIGHTVRREAENLLAHCERVERTLRDHEEVGHLRIGASFTIGNHLATRYLASYLQRYPRADVRLDIASTPEVLAKVLNYEVDVGMIEAEARHRDLDILPWREDELVVFCAANHPLASKRVLTARDIRRASWILREPGSAARQTLEHALGSLLPDIHIHLELKHNEAIKKAVESGLGIGCLSRIVLERDFSRGDLAPLELPRRDMRRSFYFVLPRARFPRESVAAWMGLCREAESADAPEITPGRSAQAAP